MPLWSAHFVVFGLNFWIIYNSLSHLDLPSTGWLNSPLEIMARENFKRYQQSLRKFQTLILGHKIPEQPGQVPFAKTILSVRVIGLTV